MKVNEQTGEVEGTDNDARVARLNAIANRNDSDRASELRDIDDLDAGLTSEFKVEDETDEQREAREAALQNASDDDGQAAAALAQAAQEANQQGAGTPAIGQPAQPAQAAAPVKHKVKLGNREVELTTEELIQRATQVEDANQHLAEAQRLRDEAQSASRQAPGSAEDQEKERRERLRQRVRAIQMGSEDEAMEALEQMERGDGASMDAATLSHAIDERMAFQTAVAWVQDEYKDLFKDERLKGMFLQEELRLVKEGDRRPYKDRYKAIGDGLRSWVGQFKPALGEGAKPAPADLDARREAKRSASDKAPPASAAQRANLDEDEDTPENTSSVIKKMADARGGSQRMRS